jgi:uncharacterized protein DUF6644
MPVPLIFQTIEQTGLSTWIRETDSLFGFYFILALHTVGLALLVGANTFVDLRILGFGSDLPLKPLKRYFSIMWWGFAINAISGVFLIIAYPTKAFTNPMFYIKLSCIAAAVVIMQMTKTRVFGDTSLSDKAMAAKGTTLAVCSLALWVASLTTGRLLAYTYTYLFYGHLAPGG